MLRLDATPEDVSPKLVLIEDADIGMGGFFHLS